MVFAMETFAHDNTTWTVILGKDGRIRNYTSLQITAYRDHTSQINLENLKPEFPAKGT